MPRYRLNGITLESEVSLPAAGAADEPGPVVRFRVGEAGTRAEPAEWLFVRELDDGRPWLSVGRDPGGYLVRIHGHADFAVDRDGGALVCHPTGDGAPAIVEQLLLDQVLPMVLHLRGQPSFHASAVLLDEPPGRGVVAFLGASGMGKSTLAASLVGPSAVLFGDDCLAVWPAAEGIVAQPSYPSLRLLPDATAALFHDRPDLPLATPRTDKRRVGLDAARRPERLARLYLLDEGDGPPRVARLGRRDAFVELTRHLHRLDPSSRECLRREMDLLEQVVTGVPVARLSYRRSFAELPAVRAAILGEARAGEGR